MVVNTARKVLPQRRNTLLAKDHAILLICDECHHYASKENRKIFSGITPDIHHYYTLGLSVTPYCEGFETVLKPSLGEVIFRYGHEDARKDQIIAPFIFEQIAVSLNGTEAESYAHLSYEISAVYKKLFDCHRTLPELPSPDSFPALNRLRDRGDELSELLFNLMMQRKRLVLEAESRINCAEKLVEALPEDHRIIIFCERISQTEAIYSLLEHKFRRQIGKYHSARASELNRRDMREYKSGSIRIMVACKALDEGIDVPEADVSIVVSGTAVCRLSYAERRWEVLRIGRLSKKAQLNAYRNMAELLLPKDSLQSTFSVFALSASYNEDVIEAKHELENLAELFPDNEEPMLTVIEKLTEARQLNPLTAEEIKIVFSRIIDFHGRAYNWQPPCSVEELMDISKSGGYLLRTKIRTAIEYMDELYQYGNGAISGISELKKESFEESTVSLEDLDL